jgi:hypothetical protein
MEPAINHSRVKRYLERSFFVDRWSRSTLA